MCQKCPISPNFSEISITNYLVGVMNDVIYKIKIPELTIIMFYLIAFREVLRIWWFTSFEPTIKLLIRLKKCSTYDVISNAYVFYSKILVSLPISPKVPISPKMPNIAEIFWQKTFAVFMPLNFLVTFELSLLKSVYRYTSSHTLRSENCYLRLSWPPIWPLGGGIFFIEQ